MQGYLVTLNRNNVQGLHFQWLPFLLFHPPCSEKSFGSTYCNKLDS